MISEKGIQVCPEKILQIQDWITLRKQIQQHLGFFNYFRETIPNYPQLFYPLERLRYEKKVKWKPEFQKIYDTALNILSSELLLSYPDFNHPFCVATDASNYGIGTVLYQEIDDEKRYISFASRTIKDSERSYGATKSELLGIASSLRKFRYYLFGKRFRLFTDHRALTYIYTQKQPNQKMQQWFEELLELDYEVIHLPGIRNILPNAISRLYDKDGDEPVIQNMNIEHESSQETETDMAERKLLLNRAHLMGHFGHDCITKALIQQGHFWMTMKEDAKKSMPRMHHMSKTQYQ
jgi:hypothetical protein